MTAALRSCHKSLSINYLTKIKSKQHINIIIKHILDTIHFNIFFEGYYEKIFSFSVFTIGVFWV